MDVSTKLKELRKKAGLTQQEVSDGDVVNVPSEVKERWPHARAVRARGTCMNKAIPDGHWFLVDPGTEPRNGDIAVVETEDYEAVVYEQGYLYR